MQSQPAVVLHPQLLSNLFAFKAQVSRVFKEVLGIKDLDYLSITRIDNIRQLMTFSARPALEYNLFKSALWRYDRTYDPSWYALETTSPWQALYQEAWYDELYYLKQIRHGLPLGLSLAETREDGYFIYSVASRRANAEFLNRQEDFYHIGRHCAGLLEPLFCRYDESSYRHTA